MADSRRSFFKAATIAIGGLVGAVVALPAAGYLLFPRRRKTVSSVADGVDVMAAKDLVAGAPPVRVQISADSVRDGWGVVSDVPLGSAYLRRDETGQVIAVSAACPHLGCAVAFDEAKGHFGCPCHKSSFAVNGDKLSGPSKRGLDPLPVVEADGRIKVTYLRFRADIADREPA